jgi:O-antigen/teichoic acid export membrane protein
VFAIFLATHAGYAAGTVAGVFHEGARRLRPRPRARTDERLVHDSAKTLIALLVATAAGTGTAIVVARALGPHGRGTFELARTVAWVAAAPAGFGLGRAAAYFRLRGRLSTDRLYGAVLGSFIGGAAAAVAVGIGLAATSSRHDLDTAEIVLVAASIPLIAFYFQGQFALRGLERPAWFRRSLALRDVLLLVLVAVAVGAGGSTPALIWVWTLHWLIGATVIGLLLLRACGPPRLPGRMTRGLMLYGMPNAMVALLSQSHLRLDVLVVQAFDGASAVGQYAVAFGTVGLLSSGGLAVSWALFPRTAVASTDLETGGAARTAAALRVSVGGSLAAAVALFLAAPVLVRFVFGATFAPSVQPLRFLLPGAVAMTAMLILQGDLAGRGKLWLLAGVYGGSVVINLGLNFMLVPGLGATGAAIASSVTYTLAAAGLTYGFLRTTGCGLMSCVVPRREDLLVARAAWKLKVSPSGARG